MMTELEADLAALADRLRASSVAIRSAGGAGSGSGVVWSATGAIVTNAHVAQTPQVEVEFAGGRILRGTVDRRDEQRDLARVRVDPHAGGTPVSPVATRDPHELRVGEFAAAFGNPLGIRDVLSTGIIFGTHRRGRDRFVRADVKIAPGNSGGALADAAGRVVGITSMVAGGLALAIPADDVTRFVAEPEQSGRLGVVLARADLGVHWAGAAVVAYAVIAVEPASVAERSGLIVGDIILASSVDGLTARSELDVVRGGRTIAVALRRAPSDRDAAA
jgi:serine protease Do